MSTASVPEDTAGTVPGDGVAGERVPDDWVAGERVPDDEVLAVEGVSVALGGRTVLDDVSFSLRAAQFTGLIGSNGAGKTTLLRVILGTLLPAPGRVVLSGRLRGRRRRRTTPIGYVPQKVLLDPDVPLRGRDLVGLGLDGQRLGVPLPSARRRAKVDEVLEAVGAAHFAEARVGTLSGGEQQRLLIAHAVIARPRLLLLDEPLANLDLHSSLEIVQLLHSIAVDQRLAVLLSAHEMNPLLPVMDSVVYLAGGRAATGTTDEVVRTEVLSRLYGHHVDVLRVHGRVIVVAGAPDEPDHPPGPSAGGEPIVRLS